MNYGAQVRVWLRNGSRLEARVSDAPGDPESPMSEAMLVAKAQSVMQAAGFSAQAAVRVSKACMDLPKATSLAPLWHALRHLHKP